MEEIFRLIEEFDKYERQQYSVYESLRMKFNLEISNFQKLLSSKQSLEFFKILTKIETLKYSLCEELIKFMLFYKKDKK